MLETETTVPHEAKRAEVLKVAEAKRYEFEGELLTVSEIAERVPVLSRRAIRKHVQAGRNTRMAMLAFNPAVKRSAGGRRAARNRASRFSLRRQA